MLQLARDIVKKNDDGAKVPNQNNVTGIPKVKKAIPHKAIPRRARKYSTKKAQREGKRLMDKLWYRNRRAKLLKEKEVPFTSKDFIPNPSANDERVDKGEQEEEEKKVSVPNIPHKMSPTLKDIIDESVT